jgi:hypothetical protein
VCELVLAARRRVALLWRRLIKEMDANYFGRGKLLMLVCATVHAVASKLIQMSGSLSRVSFALTA